MIISSPASTLYLDRNPALKGYHFASTSTSTSTLFAVTHRLHDIIDAQAGPDQTQLLSLLSAKNKLTVVYSENHTSSYGNGIDQCFKTQVQFGQLPDCTAPHSRYSLSHRLLTPTSRC